LFFEENSMALEITQPPAQSLESLSATLPQLAARAGVARQATLITHALELATQQPSALHVTPVAPVLSAPVYVLGLDAIAARRGLTSGRLVFWTHLLPSAGEEVVSADVTADTHQFAALTQGIHPGAFLQQVRTLQTSSEVEGHSYQLAQLRVPALHLNAVWLRDKVGANDIVIPLAPTPPGLEAGRRYSAADFEAALEPQARAVLAETDPLKGG
jgi:hypothetical protein